MMTRWAEQLVELARHVSADAAAMMRSPFPAWSADDLRSLFAEAGFRTVRVRIDVGAVRYPSPEELLRREASSSPLAGPVAALDPERRAALVEALDSALRQRRDDDGVVLPLEAYLALAQP